ncbi:hypothetical protein LWI29_022769 [Acer saccharum]|uniref:Protein kinase domain-containing protein n=1 Tax=Acer saccharum TaxID=4024 RepID=A0AA39VZR2_ACESA|nr:hypothetical protein LWI29_022769 [Acer saccharum]
MSLWYRPSEVMLFSHNYSYPVDLWAMGAIMAELLMLRPLFPGRNASDQMSVMCRVLGSPTTETWPEGLALAKGWKLELSIPTVFGCASLVVDAIREYRPSEVMLFSHNYSYPVDLWAMGAIMAELLMLRPLFPGRNASDQMSVMCRVLGSPTTETWPEGLALAKGWKLELSIPTVFGCASLVVDAIRE